MNGYISEFQVYVGKIQNRTENSLGERVVKDLTRTLVGKYYTVYCDSFFTGVQLFDSLFKDGIYACGTLKTNRRKYPDQFKETLEKGLSERGKSIPIKDGNKVFALWQDNKLVTMLSTNCDKGKGNVRMDLGLQYHVH